MVGEEGRGVQDSSECGGVAWEGESGSGRCASGVWRGERTSFVEDGGLEESRKESKGGSNRMERRMKG